MWDSLHYNLLRAQSLFYRTIGIAIQNEKIALTPGQPKVLDYLLLEKRAMQREIAQVCMIEPPTMTNILSRMETCGLVQRKHEDGNQRNVYVTLTELGVENAQKMKKIFKSVENQAFKGFSETEIKTLMTLLKRIEDNLH